MSDWLPIDYSVAVRLELSPVPFLRVPSQEPSRSSLSHPSAVALILIGRRFLAFLFDLR